MTVSSTPAANPLASRASGIGKTRGGGSASSRSREQQALVQDAAEGVRGRGAQGRAKVGSGRADRFGDSADGRESGALDERERPSLLEHLAAERARQSTEDVALDAVGRMGEAMAEKGAVIGAQPSNPGLSLLGSSRATANMMVAAGAVRGGLL